MNQYTRYKISAQVIWPVSGICFIPYMEQETCCRAKLALDIINSINSCYSDSKCVGLLTDGTYQKYCCFLVFEMELDTIRNIFLSCPLRYGNPCQGRLVSWFLGWGGVVLGNGHPTVWELGNL